jgi:recombination protein RecA
MKRKSSPASNEEIISRASNSDIESKKVVLQRTLDDLTKRFGDGSIVLLGNNSKMQVDVISTGSLTLDIATGVGGLPRGRITEIYGPEGSGKSSLCLHTIAEAQKLGGACAFIDMEHALDPYYARRLGVDLDTLYIAQPDTGEQALEMTEALVRSGAMDVIVVDSVAALVPRAEIEGDMGDASVGLQARLMSQAMRKITGAIKTSNCIVIFTNQLREKIGVMFGSPETTSGGRALKFYASMRLDIRRIQAIKVAEETIGSRSKVKVVKNKVAAPFREAEFDLMMKNGISKNGEIIDLGIAIGVIDKRGAFLRYNDILLGQGRSKAIDFLASNKSTASELEHLIKEKFDRDNDILFAPPTDEEIIESKMEPEHEEASLDPQSAGYVMPYNEKE